MLRMTHDINAGSALLPPYAIESGSAPRIERATWLGEGDYCRCYLVNATYVFRFANHADASAAMQVELCLLPTLRTQLPVAVPQVAFTGRRADTGHALMGYPFLAGHPLEANVLAGLPSTSQAVLIDHMAHVARSLHDLPLPSVSQCRIPILNPLVHLRAIMDHARRAVRPRVRDKVWHYYEQLLNLYLREPALHAYQPAVLHGDLSPDHLLADTQQLCLTGVIDWGDTRIGDPAWDFVYIYEDYGPKTLTALLDRYDAGNADLLARKVRLYQQLNTMDYCLGMLSDGDEEHIHEALALLEEQAITGGA